jgi:membrane associated rhomboid family serine protease
MLIPIGHEETKLRRMPWVTLTIIGLCIFAFIQTALVPSGEERTAASERRAVEYFLKHPYLELDPKLKDYIYYSLRGQDNLDIPTPEEPSEIQLEQRELDALVEAYYEVRDGTPYYRWGLVPTRQQPVSWLTHMLMHVGLLHLVGNLFILYLVGPPLEDAWGPLPFAAFFVVSGLVAAFFFIAGHPNVDEPLIGASGAIAGVMGAFAVRFWNSRITFFYWVFLIKIYTGTFTAPAWLMLGLWVLGQLAFASGMWAYMSVADMGDVAFEAHIAGFIFGAAVAFMVKKLAFEKRYVEPSIAKRQVVHQAPSVEKAHDLARRGRTDEAIAILKHDLERNPRDADAASALWSLAVAAGKGAEVARFMRPPLEASARTGDDGLPSLCWGELLRKAPEIDIEPATAVRLGEIVLAAGLEADAEETLLWLEKRIDSGTPVGLIARIARMANRLGVRAPYAELALARSELPPDVANELRAEIDRWRRG